MSFCSRTFLVILGDSRLFHKQQYLIFGQELAELEQHHVYVKHLIYLLFGHLTLTPGHVNCLPFWKDLIWPFTVHHVL